jgi:hypothetical protein
MSLIGTFETFRDVRSPVAMVKSGQHLYPTMT